VGPAKEDEQSAVAGLYGPNATGMSFDSRSSESDKIGGCDLRDRRPERLGRRQPARTENHRDVVLGFTRVPGEIRRSDSGDVVW
jgi:hypothetical protein